MIKKIKILKNALLVWTICNKSVIPSFTFTLFMKYNVKALKNISYKSVIIIEN